MGQWVNQARNASVVIRVGIILMAVHPAMRVLGYTQQ
jgi:hypothetical protein